MATVKENLIAAKALIDTPEKWIKGDYEKRGCFCAFGAISKVLGVDPSVGEYSPAAMALRHALEQINPTENVIGFNDSREHGDVMALFERAIAAQDGVQ